MNAPSGLAYKQTMNPYVEVHFQESYHKGNMETVAMATVTVVKSIQIHSIDKPRTS